MYNQFDYVGVPEKILYPPIENLNKICRELGIWKDSREPGLCWIMETVLGVDPRTVPEGGLHYERGYYETYVFTKEGSIQLDVDGYGRREVHALSATQREALKEWEQYL